MEQMWHIEEQSGNIRVGEDLGALLLAIGCGMITCEGQIAFYEAGASRTWQGLMEVSASGVTLLSHSRGDWYVRPDDVSTLEATFVVRMSQKLYMIRCVAAERAAVAVAALSAA